MYIFERFRDNAYVKPFFHTKIRQASTLVAVCVIFSFYFRRGKKKKDAFAKLMRLFKDKKKDYFFLLLWKKTVTVSESVKEEEKMVQDTVVRLHEAGRIFISFGIMLCAKRKLLNLEDDIAMHIDINPKELAVAPFERKKKITIMHLLEQTSGFCTKEEISERTGRSNFTLPELLNELNSLPLKQEPGEDVNLNGCEYDVLCMIIEVVTKLDFETFLRTNFFEPLQMQDTGTSTANILQNHQMINPMLIRVSKNTPLQKIHGADGFFSNATDLVRFFSAIFGESPLASQLLDPRSLQLLLQTTRSEFLQCFSSFGVYYNISLENQFMCIIISQTTHTLGEKIQILNTLSDSVEMFLNLHKQPPLFTPRSIRRLASMGI